LVTLRCTPVPGCTAASAAIALSVWAV